MIRQGDTIINARTGQRMTFLKTWAETNGTMLQIDCSNPPVVVKESEHIHPYQENRFTIVSGQLSFSINGKIQTAFSGEVISIPKNVAHYFWNSGEVEAHYIQEFFPALKIDGLFETFFALARDGKLNEKGIPNIFQAAMIMLAHQKELRLARPSWIIQKVVFTILAPLGRLLGYKDHYE